MAVPAIVQQANPVDLGNDFSDKPEELSVGQLEMLHLRSNDHPIAKSAQLPIDSEFKSSAIEDLAELLFSERHMRHIFRSPQLLSMFTSFLNNRRPQSAAILIYYFDALKALRAARYANAVAAALQPVKTDGFKAEPPQPVVVKELEEKVAAALRYILEEDLPAYITQIYRTAVVRAIDGSSLVSSSRQPKAGQPGELPVAFFITDCSKTDNPIIFASKTFHQMTRHTVETTFGQHPRFLYGAKTKRSSICRFEEAYREVKEHCELVLSYRSDGSVYLNLFTLAPLCDSNGQVRYFLGYQIDVNTSAHGAYELQLLNSLLRNSGSSPNSKSKDSTSDGEELIELAEMFNNIELKTIKRYGGRLHIDQRHVSSPSMSESLYDELRPNRSIYEYDSPASSLPPSIKSTHGPYRDYMLLRPFPSLHIVFTSPSLRVSGILQSPFLSWIGGSRRVREGLTVALATGRSATAKIRWAMQADDDGCTRWVHCMPLRGRTGQVGVWIVVMIDDNKVDLTKARARRSLVSAASRKMNVSQRTVNRESLYRDSAASAPDVVLPESPCEGLTRRQREGMSGASRINDWEGTCLRDDDDESD